MTNKALGTLIKQARKDKGYSQEELSTLLNVSQQRYQKWESGQVQVPFRFLPKLRKELSIEYCICNNEENE